jgi:hypothetical protein
MLEQCEKIERLAEFPALRRRLRKLEDQSIIRLTCEGDAASVLEIYGPVVE